MTKLFLQISAGILIALIISSFLSMFVMKFFFDRRMMNDMPDRMSGMVHLIKDRFDRTPKDRWPEELDLLQKILPFPIEMTGPPETEAAGVRESLSAGKTATVRSEDGHIIYIPIGAGSGVLKIGLTHRLPPMRVPHFLLSIAIPIPIVAVIGFLLAYPVVHRLKILENAAVRIAEGDLEARAAIISSDAVGSLAQRFNLMADKIQTLLENQRHLLQAVSHELRTPISRISFMLEMLSRDAEPESRNERIAAIESDLAELEQLIGELLLYCRLDVENPYGNMETFAVKPAVERIVEQASLRDHGKSFSLHADDALRLEIKANPRYFDRAVQNVLNNAIRYAAAKIDIRIGAEDGFVLVEIGDDGPGISAEDRMRIFKPFARLDDSRSRQSGSVGLGLAIVQRVLASHGGSVEVAENQGGGARFLMRWPKAG